MMSGLILFNNSTKKTAIRRKDLRDLLYKLSGNVGQLW